TRREALRKAEAERDEALAVSSASGASSGTAERHERLERTVAARRLRADNAEVADEVLRALVDANAAERESWQSRYRLLNERADVDLRETSARIEMLRRRLERWQALGQREYELALEQLNGAPRELAEGYRERVALYDRLLRTNARVAERLNRWQAELDAASAAAPLWTRAKDAWEGARGVMRTVWDFELFSADDTLEVDGRKITAKRSVTVGKSIGAIVLLVLGYVIVSWLVRRLERTMVSRLKADPA